MYKVRTFVTAAALAVAVLVPVVGTQMQSVSAETLCGVYPSSKKFVVNADNTITGSFKVEGDANCKAGASVMVWNADPSLQPKPEFWTTQRVFEVKSDTLAPGEYSFTVKLPVCSTDPKIVSGYQADVIASANPSHTLTPPNTGGFYDGRQPNGGYMVMEAKVAGNKCPAPVTPAPVTPSTTTPAPTPEVPVVQPAVTTTPESLPAAGAGGVLTLGGVVSAISTIGYSLIARRRSLNA